MHTAHVTDDSGREWAVHHNSDYSGDVLFTFNQDDITALGNSVTVEVPFSVMRELVGRWLRDEQISYLENITGEQLVNALRLPRAELD